MNEPLSDTEFVAMRHKDEPRAITVSREALRAELSELELRLRIWIGEELVKKANQSEVDRLHALLDEKITWAESQIPLRDKLILEHEHVMQWREDALKGHFTDAQVLAMKERLSTAAMDVERAGWSRRERIMAVVVVMVSVGAFSIDTLTHLGVF